MRKLLLSLLFICFFVLGNAQERPIQVACVGNSITEGAGIFLPKKNGYPAQLGELLGEAYEVTNFGLGGRTLLRKGDIPYFEERYFKEVIDLKPEIIVIKLGTNDSKPQNWKYGAEFKEDLNAMIDSFSYNNPTVRIFLCRPVPVYKDRWGITESIISNEIWPIIKSVAKKRKLETIDLYTPLLNHEDFFPDKVHPNEEGAKIMAETVYKAIKK